MNMTKVISGLKAAAIPLGGIMVAGVVAYSTYNVDQALHQRDFDDLVEELADLDEEFEEFVRVMKEEHVQFSEDLSSDFVEIKNLQNQIEWLRSQH